jgi:hypothetical protein
MSIMALIDRGAELARASSRRLCVVSELEILAASVQAGTIKKSPTTKETLISGWFRSRFMIRRVIFAPFLGIDEECESILFACCNVRDCLTSCYQADRKK